MYWIDIPFWQKLTIMFVIAHLAMIVGSIIVSTAYKQNPSKRTGLKFAFEFLSRLLPVTAGVIIASYIVVLMVSFSIGGTLSLPG